jgi:two-component system response regulator FixJ
MMDMHTEDRIQTVYVIDDSGEMRRSLHFLLDTMGMRTRPFASAEDFIDSVATLPEAPLLIDLRMPQMDGLQLMQELHARGLEWPVIFMTAHGDVPVAVRAMKLGAIEFLEKPFEPEELETALGYAFAAVSEHDQVNAVHAAAAERLDRLTRREFQVVERLAQGTPNKLIAHDMGLSARTIEMHRSNALDKLGVKNVAELIALLKDAAPGG